MGTGPDSGVAHLESAMRDPVYGLLTGDNGDDV